jgi:hypothetical protein
VPRGCHFPEQAIGDGDAGQVEQKGDQASQVKLQGDVGVAQDTERYGDQGIVERWVVKL